MNLFILMISSYNNLNGLCHGYIFNCVVCVTIVSAEYKCVSLIAQFYFITTFRSNCLFVLKLRVCRIYGRNNHKINRNYR